MHAARICVLPARAKYGAHYAGKLLFETVGLTELEIKTYSTAECVAVLILRNSASFLRFDMSQGLRRHRPISISTLTISSSLTVSRMVIA